MCLNYKDGVTESDPTGLWAGELAETRHQMVDRWSMKSQNIVICSRCRSERGQTGCVALLDRDISELGIS
jgi:hypothetical protein